MYNVVFHCSYPWSSSTRIFMPGTYRYALLLLNGKSKIAQVWLSPTAEGLLLAIQLSAFMLCLLNLHKIKHKKQLAEQVCSLCSLFSSMSTNRSLHNTVGWILLHSFLKKKNQPLLCSKPNHFHYAQLQCSTLHFFLWRAVKKTCIC